MFEFFLLIKMLPKYKYISSTLASHVQFSILLTSQNAKWKDDIYIRLSHGVTSWAEKFYSFPIL